MIMANMSLSSTTGNADDQHDPEQPAELRDVIAVAAVARVARVAAVAGVIVLGGGRGCCARVPAGRRRSDGDVVTAGTT